MMRILFISVLLVSALAISQEKLIETDAFSILDDVDILDEPRFYRSYFSEYNLNNNLFFRLEMQEQSNGGFGNSHTLIEYPSLLKYNITNKHSILFGPKVNVFKVNGTVEDVSLFSTFGYQYNITEDLSVDARVNYKMKSEPIYSTNNPTSFSDFVIYRVGAKLKF
jgi:hypothetical protein